uniref:Uncharacterized protein n=1 Tax=Solanum lycopersicum TaxID=4081 RepID=A0A3Q7EBT6_SOLLC
MVVHCQLEDYANGHAVTVSSVLVSTWQQEAEYESGTKSRIVLDVAAGLTYIKEVVCWLD